MSRRPRPDFARAQPSPYAAGELPVNGATHGQANEGNPNRGEDRNPTARNVGFVRIGEFNHSTFSGGFVQIADLRMHGDYVARHVGRGDDILTIESACSLSHWRAAVNLEWVRGTIM